MQSINYNKENYPILNQIYDILADLLKQITLCKILASMGVMGNEEVDSAVKQAIDMPGMTVYYKED